MPDGSFNSGPIFIIGMNGSGTTMLLDHLNSHSQIYGFAEETRILPHYIHNYSKSLILSNPKFHERMWRELCSAFPFWKANNESPIPIPENWRDIGQSPAAVFDYILSTLAALSGKSIWCEKTPMHAMHVAELGDAFPTARFIHMLRDGRDCAASFGRRWGYNENVSIYRWKKTIRTARQQARTIGPGRYTELYFESLTSDPVPVLQDLCRFLNIQFEESMLTASRTAERARGITEPQITPNSGSYQTYFSATKINSLESIAGAMLSELGYSVANRNGDKDVAKTFVWLHQTVAQVRRIPSIVTRAKTSKKPLRLLINRIRTGLNYRKSSHL